MDALFIISNYPYLILLAGINTIALALLATCGINGLITLRQRQIIRFGFLSLHGGQLFAMS